MCNVKCEMDKGKEEKYKDFVFDFEKLDVYQLALKFIHKLITMVKNLPPELRLSLGNNLVRAGMSIINNIAEGSGKKSLKEKRRYYGTSLDSARECIPTITVVHREGHINDEHRDELRNDCLEICNKMAKLIQSVEMTFNITH